MLNLSLRQLQALRVVAQVGRINEAAEKMGLTPPAVTLQVKQAEAEIGAELFERTRGGLVPTEIGLVAIAAAHDVHERMRALDDEIAALVTGRLGRVRLGAVSTAKYFVPSMIAGFQAANPGIEVTLLVGNRSETIERLRQRELDIVIMGRPPRGQPLEASVIGDHPFVVIAPPDHELAGRRGITKERIARETFLLRERGSGTRSSLDLFFSDIPEKVENPGLEMGSNESIKQAVMAGLGVAMISAHTVALEVQSGRLAVLDVKGMPIVRQWFCIAPAGRPLAPATRAMKDFLVETGPGMLPHVPFDGSETLFDSLTGAIR